MTPDDPRHGTNAGYQAHRKADQTPCDDCYRGRLRARKAIELDRLSGEQLHYSYDELLDLLGPWLALGLGPSAVTDAAGLGCHRGGGLLVPGRPVRRQAFHQIAAVTEDDLSPRAKLWSHLTAQRIGSLMADGHTVTSMPVNLRGQWRYRDKISVETARSIRDFFTENRDTSGPNVQVRARALNLGHLPPMAWDDPGTLAWPLGWTEPIVTTADIDPVVVDRIICGDFTVTSTHAERCEVTRRWVADGRSLNSLRMASGWKVERYNQRPAGAVDQEHDTEQRRAS